MGPSTQDAAFVLHTRRYREHSLLVEALTREHGRIGLVARLGSGRRRAAKDVLQAFRPLLLVWRGRGELHSLTHWETTEVWPALRDERLLSGLYLNELVVRLAGRGEGDPRLFERYAATLALIAHGEALEPVLRAFEVALLEISGYGLELTQTVDTEEALAADCRYDYVPELGPHRGHGRSGAIAVDGATLLALGGRRPLDAAVLPDAKRFMRALLAHHLGERPLHARSLFAGGDLD
ncbi:MAG TPA: DNA repair protein RecO [Gammaproteobacteria bacterium]|nr:DNA repair protein RecO [Gammaproteobacteria bacterium]